MASFCENTGDRGLLSISDDCQQIQRNATTGRIDNIFKPTYNMGSLRTQGVDVQLDWNRQWDSGGLLRASSVLSWVDRYEVQTLKGGVRVGRDS